MADAGLRLTVEGEKEFKAALAEIDAAVKSNQKSMKLLTEEFKLNETGMKDATSGFGSMADAAKILADKGKVLADSIEVQSEKVGLLDARVKEASEAYGEHDKRTEALRAQLLDASTALAKMTAEQEKNRQAILDAENSTREYDEAVKVLEAQLAANEAELKAMGGGLDALKKEYGDLEKESGDLEKSTGALGKIFGSTGKDAETLKKQEENLGKQNETLRAQNEKLTDSISKQRDLTEKLAAAQEVAVKRYGEGSKEAEAYRKKLADATGQLDAMERELRENEKAIGDNNKAIEAGGEAPNPMLDGLKKIEEMTGIKIPAGIETMISGFDTGTAAVGGIVTALLKIADTMKGIVEESLSWSTDITTNSQELDLSTTEYQALGHAAQACGFDVESIWKAMKKLNQQRTESDAVLSEWIGRMDELKYASDDVKKSVTEQMNYWTKLGVSLYDSEGNLKSTKDLLYDVIDALGRMESDTERTQISMDLFGKKFEYVNPLIKTGSQRLRELEEGYKTAFGEDVVARMDEVNRQWDLFKNRVDMATKEAIMDMTGIGKEAKGLSGILKDLWDSSDIGALIKVFKGEATWEKWLSTVFGISGKYASGTNYAPGGMALVGERGPEIVDLPRGSKVYPNGTAPQLGGETVYETNTYNVTIDAKNVEEFNDIVRIAQSARVGMRRG